MSEEQEDLTDAEKAEVIKYANAQFPQQEEKLGVFQFLNKVLTGGAEKGTKIDKDINLKGSNLDTGELISVRTYESASIYANQMGLGLVGNYLDEESRAITATALSKKGFLVLAAITQKKEMRANIGKNKEKSGWFKQKESDGSLGGQ